MNNFNAGNNGSRWLQDRKKDDAVGTILVIGLICAMLTFCVAVVLFTNFIVTL